MDYKEKSHIITQILEEKGLVLPDQTAAKSSLIGQITPFRVFRMLEEQFDPTLLHPTSGSLICYMKDRGDVSPLENLRKYKGEIFLFQTGDDMLGGNPQHVVHLQRPVQRHAAGLINFQGWLKEPAIPAVVSFSFRQPGSEHLREISIWDPRTGELSVSFRPGYDRGSPTWGLYNPVDNRYNLHPGDQLPGISLKEQYNFKFPNDEHHSTVKISSSGKYFPQFTIVLPKVCLYLQLPDQVYPAENSIFESVHEVEAN